ncbi:MAG: thiamine-phosphate kinase [Candidatus Bathyarchaeota archaeon]|nr:thiamine-phosphate kinase [Candidatus Bathyarchaeota archaeon]
MESPAKSVRDLGEREIIKIIIEKLGLIHDMPIPFGDDVAAISLNDNRLIIVKADMLVGRTDVPPGMSFRQAARKAIVMSVSDFAAKGVKPLAALVSLGLPSNLTEREVEEIGLGLNDGAKEYGVLIIGGDTNEASDLVIDCIVIGLCEEKKVVKRSGAKPGDILAVTGYFGKTSAGLKILLEGLSPPENVGKPLVESVLLPKARLKEGLILADLGALTASIDSSDGLAWSLHELSDASKVGFIIRSLPIAPEAMLFAEEYNLDPISLSLYGGEEYELVVTVKPEMFEKAKSALKNIGAQLMEIGEVVGERRICVEIDGKRAILERKGWEHFKSTQLSHP